MRAAVARQSDLGLKAKSYMDQGELVPDHLILDLVKERLSQEDASGGWILDGFPRNVSQALFLEELLQTLDSPFDCVINLDVPDEVLLARLLGRGRADDNEETIRQRLVVYREQTAPLIDFYRNRQQLFSIDGSQPIETVTAALQKMVQCNAS